MNPRPTRVESAVKKKRAAEPPQKSKRVTKRYSQTIFSDWCKACGICAAFCPKKVIARDHAGNPVIERSDDCIGCRFCEFHCPDFAITIRERKVTPRKQQA